MTEQRRSADRRISLASPTGVRCASWTRQRGGSPVGTAGFYRGVLVLEWPLPWPRDVAEISELASVATRLREEGVRLQCAVPPHPGAERRATFYRLPKNDPGFVRFDRVEFAVPAEHLADSALELALAAPEGGEHRSVAGVDVLVCSHGARDVCCGGAGTRLARAVDSLIGDRTRVLRTSHLGGHRFAPTALVLPQGTSWAFADEALLQQIVERRGDHKDALDHYRGCCAIGPPAVQTLERVAFADIGWDWLEFRRWGSVSDEGVARVEAVSPAGRRFAWEGRVERRSLGLLPPCGEAIGDDAGDEIFEFEVADVTRSG